MPQVKWTFTWAVDSPLHLGSGLSQPGFADRILRRNRANQVEITGDAVKGAIRLSAERFVRWYLPAVPDENDEDATLHHPALQRIFANTGAVRYRFQPAAADAESFRAAATAINPSTGTAENETLRIVENLESGSKFNVVVTATGPSLIKGDLGLLTVAILLTTAIGARRTAGLGQLRCTDLKLEGDTEIDIAGLASQTIAHLQAEPCIA